MSRARKFIQLLLFFFITGWLLPVAYAKPPITDEEITRRLSSGEGGIIVGETDYVVRKGINLETLPKFKSLDDLITQVMEKQDRSVGELYILTPESGNKEQRIRLEKNLNFFLILGKPGEYVVTRYIFPSNMGSIIETHRIFGRMQVESGKLKYTGDLVTLATKKGATHRELDSRFDPQRFIESFKTIYPRSSQFVITESLHSEPTARDLSAKKGSGYDNEVD